MPDDSKGEKEIYRIEDFEPVSFPHTSSPNIFFKKKYSKFLNNQVPLEESAHGMFFAGDSYVIKYSYENKEGRPAYIVYFWQVRMYKCKLT